MIEPSDKNRPKATRLVLIVYTIVRRALLQSSSELQTDVKSYV